MGLVKAAAQSGTEISYAAKAFATVEFLRHLAQHPIGVDVCSLGELITAERAGFAAERITLHGAGKSDEELRAVSAGRIGCIAIDGLEELERLAVLSRDGAPVNVVLRLNVGIEAGSHAFVRTGGDTKFGIPAHDEVAAARLVRENRQLRFMGLHAHIGSQIDDAAVYASTASLLIDGAERFARNGLNSARLVIGGGFAVASQPAGETLNAASALAAAFDRIAKDASARGMAAPRLGVEPGRAIVALAGTTLYQTLAVKRQSQRTFVVVDGGIAENPRPALYGAHHHVVAATSLPGALEEMTICGRSCENDELATVRLPRSIASGALLAMCSTGAYTYSMAGNYNRFPRPAVCGVAGGRHRPLARRESIDDVLRRDAVP